TAARLTPSVSASASPETGCPLAPARAASTDSLTVNQITPFRLQPSAYHSAGFLSTGFKNWVYGKNGNPDAAGLQDEKTAPLPAEGRSIYGIQQLRNTRPHLPAEHSFHSDQLI